MKIKLSQKQWESIGKKAGWMPRDPTDVSDADLGPIMTAEEEENVLLGPEENDPFAAYKDGYKRGLEAKKQGSQDTSGNPYRTDTESGVLKSDQWMRGFKDAWDGKPSVY